MTGEQPGGAQAASPLATLDATPALARQTVTYAVAGAIAPAISVVLLPVFARAFTRTEYGLLELGMTLATIALTTTDLSLVAASQRSYFDYTAEQERERRRVLSTAFLATTALTLVVAVALVALRDPVAVWLFGSDDQSGLVAAVAATLLTGNTFRFVTEVMRLRFQATEYLFTSAIATVVGSVVSVVVVVVYDAGVTAIFLASLISNGLACAYGAVIVRDAIGGGFSRRELRTMLIFGLPLVPTTLTAWALALVDRVILARLADLEDVGLYAIATRITSLIILAVNAFQLALGPFLYSLYTDDPELEKAARGRTLTYLTFVLSAVALTGTLFAREVLSVLAPSFEDAYVAVGPLAFGTVAYGVAALLTTAMALARRTVYLLVLSVVAAGANIGLNLALVPRYGFVGAAFATGAGYAVLATSYYWAGQRTYHTPYELRSVATILAGAGALAALGVVSIEPRALDVGVRLAALGVFVAGVRLTGAMTGQEFRELRRFVVGMLPKRRRGADPA